VICRPGNIYVRVTATNRVLVRGHHGRPVSGLVGRTLYISEPTYSSRQSEQSSTSREVEDETTVDERFSVTVPAAVRRAAGVEAGDRLRWAVDEDGSLSVEPPVQRVPT
jgi:AbrB family looped-hinge helix DNA binding protein